MAEDEENLSQAVREEARDVNAVLLSKIVQEAAAAAIATVHRAQTDVPSDPDSKGVGFSPEAYAQLEEMARRKGKSVPATVRDALSLVAWIDEQLADGGRLIVEPKGGKRQVLTPKP